MTDYPEPAPTSNGIKLRYATVGTIFGVIITLSGLLLTLGGDRQRIFDHIEATEPLRTQAANHLSDREAHLSPEEAHTLAVASELFKKVDSIDERVRNIERLLIEWRKGDTRGNR